MQFTVKTLFATTTGACAFVFIAAEYPLFVAALTVAATAILLAALIAVSFLRRSIYCLVIATTAIAYLVVADGGSSQTAVRYLPTEHALELLANPCGTYFDNGRRRSNSLGLWLTRVLNEPAHKDYPLTRRKLPLSDPPSENVRDSNLFLDELLSMVEQSAPTTTAVSLPTIAVVTVNTISRSRHDPNNRPLYIIGHCLFVLLPAAWAISHCQREDLPSG